MELARTIGTKLNLPSGKVSATIELLDAGNTLPFIARYRKEITGGLDEAEIREVETFMIALRKLDARRKAIVSSLQEQGQLTPELMAKLDNAEALTELEDLYQPYRPKRRTRASAARESGLEPLAAMILKQPAGIDPEGAARSFVREGVETSDDALAGARDIVAEIISDHPTVRGFLREKALKFSRLQSIRRADKEDEKGVFRVYYEFEARVDRIHPHQILAINRGESQKVLRVSLHVPEQDWRRAVERVARPNPNSGFAAHIEAAIEDGVKRLLLPAIERDVRRALTERAEIHAIQVFAHNLRGLLGQPPITGRTILAIDPGFRTGCKIAVVDPTGAVRMTDTIFPHAPQNRGEESLSRLAEIAAAEGVNLIAIGNGTASRETEAMVAELIRRVPELALKYLVVNEAGASVYSASELARKEMPDLDVSLRSAVSIARRVQDPLAELVKITPRSIGVGMYQHDVNEQELERTLDGVVESVVNSVGVDANTASQSLLTHVAGIGPRLAERFVAYRNDQGAFRSRQELMQVPGLGPKAYEQAAGFLRIREGVQFLDSSAIHPESYEVASRLMQMAGITGAESVPEKDAQLNDLRNQFGLQGIAGRLGCGTPTLEDIMEQLVRPGRDPRRDLPSPILRSDVLSMKDLVVGTYLKGTVRNVVDFGAFVDIGVKQDGLLHRSKIPAGQSIVVGDILSVEILMVDEERGRISLGWADSV